MLNRLRTSGSPPETWDPYWDNVEMLLRATASGIVDMKGLTPTLNVPVVAAVSGAPQGAYGGRLGSNGAVYTARQAILTGDFTAEINWFAAANHGGAFPFNQAATTGVTMGFVNNVTPLLNRFGYTNGLSSSTTTNWLLSNIELANIVGTWTHMALTRQGGYMRLFANGLKVMESDLPTNFTRTIHSFCDNMSSNGYFQEGRLTLGVARYVANFTPPVGQFLTVGPP